MKIVTDKQGEPPLVWQWLNKQTNLPWSTDLRVIGLMRDDFTFAAAIGYNGWVEDSCCFIHLAFDTPRSMTRELIREAFSYPFKTVDVIYGMTPITKENILAFNRRMGFREIHRTNHFVLQEMRKEECRWLKGVARGQRISTSRT